MASRPLSPHLQVYRWQIQMMTSILHRATGIILFIGSLFIAWALIALAAGPEHWAVVAGYAHSALGLLIVFGWIWALAYHLINGVRHLVQDAGFGYRIESFVRNSWISVVGSLALTALVYLVAMMPGGSA